MALYKTREQAAEACVNFTDKVEELLRQTKKYAKKNLAGLAWKCADNAKGFAECAMVAHDELWKMSDETLTDDEHKKFYKAETAVMMAQKAVAIAAAAVDKIQSN